ncbi:leucine rich repeat protein [Leptospira interrogans serovar Bataviae str. HAI135]|nr:leucine rich repeat protein [Leptospira interrogans serovar Bataviae str. HAI135]
MTDEKLKYLLVLPNLSDLSLTKTRITEAGLESIKENKIISLELDGTFVTNKAIKVLQGWKHLRFLNISYTKINRDAIPDLLKLKLQSIEVAGLNFSESDIKRLEQKGISVRNEEYEIQCPGTADSKCPEF